MFEEEFLRLNAGRHFVALTYKLQRAGSEPVRDHASCFVIDVGRGVWCLVTAGHVIKGLRERLAEGWSIEVPRLVDAFAGVQTEAIPFDLRPSEWLEIGRLKMKVSKLKRHRRRSPTNQAERGGAFILDEFHLFAASAGAVIPQPSPRPGSRTLIVTQSIEHDKRGKRVLLGATRDAATGHPFPPRPKKFLPVQVLRRQAS